MPTKGLLDIIAAWGPDTAQHPTDYTERNRARGQCCPTALLVQDLCGGGIMTCFVGLRRHYFNRLPDSTIVDLTASQFPYGARERQLGTTAREQLLKHPDVLRRYTILRDRAGIRRRE